MELCDQGGWILMITLRIEQQCYVMEIYFYADKCELLAVIVIIFFIYWKSMRKL